MTVIPSSIRRFLFILLFGFAPMVAMMPSAQAQDVPPGVPSASEAMTAFGNFAKNAKKFTWLILLLGVVVGAIAWGLFGSQKTAIGVIIAAAFLALGSYLIGFFASGATGSI